MRVLIGCETSGVMRRAFADRGHDVWSCDLLRATTADGAPYLRLRQQGMSDIRWSHRAGGIQVHVPDVGYRQREAAQDLKDFIVNRYANWKLGGNVRVPVGRTELDAMLLFDKD